MWFPFHGYLIKVLFLLWLFTWCCFQYTWLLVTRENVLWGVWFLPWVVFMSFRWYIDVYLCGSVIKADLSEGQASEYSLAFLKHFGYFSLKVNSFQAKRLRRVPLCGRRVFKNVKNAHIHTYIHTRILIISSVSVDVCGWLLLFLLWLLDLHMF